MEKCMGEMGRYHWVVTLSLFLIKFPASWHLISHGIMVPKSTPIYCANTTHQIKDEMTSTELNILKDEACSKSCPEIIMDTKYYDLTIVNQFQLYCDLNFMVTLAQTIVMLGVFFGNIFFGIIADKYGRKLPLVISVGVQALFGVGVAFSPTIGTFLLCKFFLNFFVGGTMITSFVLFSELVGVKWRSLVGILFQIPYSLGHASLALFAYLFRDWRWFQLCISLPSLLLVSYWWFIPESPRWLLVVGKKEEGIEALEFMARKNGLPTDHIRSTVEMELEKRHAIGAKPVEKGRIKDLFSTRMMVVISVGMWINWFAVTMCFYGAAQYVGSIGSSVYLNFILTALIQIPGTLFLIFAFERFGRRSSMMLANLIPAASFLVMYFMPSSMWVVMCASVAMFGLAMSFPGCYVYSGELFPTVVRNVGIGSSSMLGRVGGILAAIVADLKVYYDWLPSAIFGFCMTSAAVMCFFLPETRGMTLPDTVEEADNFRKPKPVPV